VRDSAVELGGSISVAIAGGVLPRTLQWYDATPTNANINFYNNPPNMGGAPVIATSANLGLVTSTPSTPAGLVQEITRWS